MADFADSQIRNQPSMNHPDSESWHRCQQGEKNRPTDAGIMAWEKRGDRRLLSCRLLGKGHSEHFIQLWAGFRPIQSEPQKAL